MNAPLSARGARRGASPTTDTERAARAHRARLTQRQTTTGRPDCTPTTKGPRP